MIDRTLRNRIAIKNMIIETLLGQNNYKLSDMTQEGGSYYLHDEFVGYCRDDVIDCLERNLEKQGSPL